MLLSYLHFNLRFWSYIGKKKHLSAAFVNLICHTFQYYIGWNVIEVVDVIFFQLFFTEEKSWRCLVSLEDSKICDCFSDCPGDADEAYCHSRSSHDPFPSPSEQFSSYRKCCSLLAEQDDLEATNISPQAIKFCQASAPSDGFSHSFQNPNPTVYRRVETHFPSNGSIFSIFW